MDGKYFLLPVQELARINTASALDANNYMQQSNAYAERIKSLLKTKMPDDVSNQLLSQAINNYDAFKAAELNKPVAIPIHEPTPVAESHVSPQQQLKRKAINMSVILKNIQGKKPKQAARNILSSLVSHPDIEVTDHNEIILRNKLIPNSNLGKIVADLARNVKKSPAIGTAEVGQFLVDQGLPPKMIANMNRRRLFEDDTPAFVMPYKQQTPHSTPLTAKPFRALYSR